MQVKSIAECSNGRILQYFWPSLLYHWWLKSLFCLFLSGHLRQVLLYVIHVIQEPVSSLTKLVHYVYNFFKILYIATSKVFANPYHARYFYAQHSSLFFIQFNCRNFMGLFVCFCCFTSHVNSYGHCGTVSSLNHTFSWAGLSKRLTSNLCTYFRL